MLSFNARQLFVVYDVVCIRVAWPDAHSFGMRRFADLRTVQALVQMHSRSRQNGLGAAAVATSTRSRATECEIYFSLEFDVWGSPPRFPSHLGS